MNVKVSSFNWFVSVLLLEYKFFDLISLKTFRCDGMFCFQFIEHLKTSLKNSVIEKLYLENENKLNADVFILSQ